MRLPNTPDATWQWTRLGDLCRFTNGYPFRPEDWADQGQPIIRIQNLNGGEEFNFWDRPIEDRYQVEPGDLLFAWSGNRGTSFGPYVWRGNRGLVNQHIFKVSPSAGVSKEWLFQALDVVRAEAEKQAHGGSGLVHVRHSDLVEYPVLTPPPAEQAHIAEMLDTLDEAIRRTRERIEKNSWIYHGMQDRFFAPNAVQNREGWQESRLEETSESITSGPRGWACYYADEGNYFLRIGNLTRKHLDLRFDDVVMVQPPAGAEGVRTALAPGDLLISITADLGIIGVVPDWMGVAYINQHIARARLNRSRVNPRFLGYQLSGQIGQKQFYRLNDVGAKAGLNLPTVGRLKVWLPSLAEQNQIATALDTVQMSLREDEVILEKLVGLKSGLSSDLLTGRVRTRPQ